LPRVDYSQVLPCEGPERGRYWTKKTIIFAPERYREFDRESEKWIPAEYLNTKRKAQKGTARAYNKGSKALVARRTATGTWCIICIKEAVHFAS